MGRAHAHVGWTALCPALRNYCIIVLINYYLYYTWCDLRIYVPVLVEGGSRVHQLCVGSLRAPTYHIVALR